MVLQEVPVEPRGGAGGRAEGSHLVRGPLGGTWETRRAWIELRRLTAGGPSVSVSLLLYLSLAFSTLALSHKIPFFHGHSHRSFLSLPLSLSLSPVALAFSPKHVALSPSISPCLARSLLLRSFICVCVTLSLSLSLSL